MRTLLRALAVICCAATSAAAQDEPPRRLDFSTDTVAQPARRDTATVTSPPLRTAFVRSQTILGMIVYAPAFATMVSDDGVTATAAYFVMAGGSFFASSEVTRQVVITPARQFLSSRVAWRGAINGLVIGNSTDLARRPTAALTLLGGVGGTTIGLVMGRDMSEGEAVSAVVGHDVAAVSALLLSYAIDPTDDGRGITGAGRGIGASVIGWGGYALGRRYARTALHEVTPGDALLLWTGASLGATALGAVVAELDPSPQAVAGTVLVGGLAGVWAADRWLVRRYDHTSAEGTLVSLGATAGGLMGIGVGVLVAGEAERGASLTLALAALGGIGGVVLTERYVQPRRDEGRQYLLDRVEVNPMGAVAAAMRAPGRHSLVRFTF